jgi:hypothetical protein
MVQVIFGDADQRHDLVDAVWAVRPSLTTGAGLSAEMEGAWIANFGQALHLYRRRASTEQSFHERVVRACVIVV